MYTQLVRRNSGTPEFVYNMTRALYDYRYIFTYVLQSYITLYPYALCLNILYVLPTAYCCICFASFQLLAE